MDPDAYLRAVEAGLGGSGAAQKRLLAELRDHVEEALEAGGRPHDVMERVGAPEDVVGPWRTQEVAARAQSRRRAAVLALAVSSTAALGIAQHASGHRAPPLSCPARHAPSPAHCPR